MFSKKFVTDLAERAISTFAQAYVAAAVVTGGIFDVQALKIGAGAFVLSIFKGVAASYKGDPQTASVLSPPAA